MSDSAAVSDAVIAHLRAMRTWLRFFGVTATLVALWVFLMQGVELLDVVIGASRPRLEHGVTLVTVITLALASSLIWRQASAVNRFVAAPSEELFVAVASEMRRFWRICGPLGLGVAALLLAAFVRMAS